MPLFDPFAGLRYDTEVVRLDQVIAPPYDIIESPERVRLATRHPANAVLIELPEPDLIEGLDRYQVAAQLLSKWRGSRLLVPEKTPALYPYRMTTKDGRSSIGVLGALGLAETGDGSDILPHEQTLPKAKTDRLDLLRATQANISPIWGLSLTKGLTQTFLPEGPPVAEAFDDDGVRHELWVLDDPARIAEVSAAVRRSPVVIADGHHRYETALNYRREVREKNGDKAGDHDSVMALVVELTDEQLTVGPIHRTFTGLSDTTDLPGIAGEWFDVVRAGDLDERTVEALSKSGSMALLTKDTAWLLTPRPEAYKTADSDLDSSLVNLIINRLTSHSVVYKNSIPDALRAVTSGEAQGAVLLRPPTVEQINEWAAARKRMPPKTSYFSPKPRTGMVIRVLATPA